MKVDYIAIMQRQLRWSGGGVMTDMPKAVKLPSDAIVEVRYDTEAMRWIPNRPSRIVYPTASELIEQYRREYVEKVEGQA